VTEIPDGFDAVFLHRIAFFPEEDGLSISPSMFLALAGMAQPPQRASLNLTDTLSGEAKLLPRFLQSAAATIIQAGSQFQNTPFPRRQATLCGQPSLLLR
jgi:hypothetical protein